MNAPAFEIVKRSRTSQHREAVVLETDRLVLRRLSVDDAEFMLGLLNEPSFLRFIGDRGVRTVDDAREYLLNGPIESYRAHGFGLYMVQLKSGPTQDVPIGICGLLKRDALDDVDLGFALLPSFWSKGYATESAAAVVAHGRDEMGLERLVAITNPDNAGSINVLEKLGMRFSKMVRLVDTGPETKLFELDGL